MFLSRLGVPQPPQRQPLGVEDSLAGLEAVLAARGRRGPALRGRDQRRASAAPTRATSTPRAVFEIARRLAAAGAAGDRLRRHDRDGQPAAGARVLRARAATSCREVELTAHFHNTRGQGLANVLAALEAGVDSFESSFGELGGCPVPPGATGNIATEDLVSMLARDGDRDRRRPRTRCSPPPRAARDVLGRPLGSHTLVAGPVDWHR